MNYHLAIDIGASSGRAVLGWLENGLLQIKEVHRFSNGMVERNGNLCWDSEKLFAEIILGMKKCAEIDKIPKSVGIDTWAVDFVLLDDTEHVLGDTVAYRDKRTDGIDEIVYGFIPEEELYRQTGIQRQPFNTIFQLMSLKKEKPDLLKQAAHFLMMPDYLHYRLCGALSNEYSNATTTGLINAHTRHWDADVINRLGFPKHLFNKSTMPGTALNRLTPVIKNAAGYDCTIIAPSTHDTSSAVITVPDGVLYISSGTWSLMGVETKTPNCSPESRTANFTNEGGYDGRILYRKNIMGLWMIQRVQQELTDEYSFPTLCDMAEKADISSVVDCNDNRFLAPGNMIKEIQAACSESGQPAPQTPGELAAVVYQSLAVCYAKTAAELERQTGVRYNTIYIVGGGANADYLNRLTAQKTGKTVLAGLPEATAVGNMAVQMIADRELTDLTAARACIQQSFTIKNYGA